MQSVKPGYFLIETIIAFAVMIVVTQALFRLASHVVALRIKIEKQCTQQKTRSLNKSQPTQFTFAQINVPKGCKVFTTSITCKTEAGDE